MKHVPLVLLLIALAGCGTGGSTSTDQSPADAEPSAGVAGSGVSSSLPPSKSPEDLAAAYKAAFERGDKAAIEQMVYWEGIPADHRDWTLRAVFNIRFADGVHGKILTAEVVDPEAVYLNSDAYPLPASKMLSGSWTGDGGGGDLRIPIGEINGQYYFCARKPAR